MKIIAAAALAAATLILTAAVPASADDDHGMPKADQQGSPGYSTTSANGEPLKLNINDRVDTDLPHGVLPRIMGHLL